MTLLLILILLVMFMYYVARMNPSMPMICMGVAIILLAITFSDWIPGILMFGIWLLFGLIAVVLNVEPIRQKYLTGPVLKRIRQILPPISNTEQEAIDAGTIWWEAELFKGDPDWNKLNNYPSATLSETEQAFLNGPVEELCVMLDDWDITHNRNDLPPEVWQFIKDNKFFGLIIPEEYGGLEFSPVANSEIVMKIASRSGTAGVTVMVPNSLGPAELLAHYGTQEQKDYYLPRLAKGEEIPCFALTGPYAGSDAGAMTAAGFVCEQEIDGEKKLGFKVNWEKRYITLGPVATVLGLAFKAFDPDGLLGGEEELGITCALVPVNTPGVDIGKRHLPLNSSFMNGPNEGKDVFVPFDWVVGGQEQIGRGWRMLMELLAAGRAISLPASGVAMSKVSARTTGAYARIREQFNIPIGKFEGVQEALARIGGLTYMLDATRLFSLAALQMGEKPSVVSAIAKYHLTEGGRTVINDAMDVHGGRGICMGPKNYLARAYQQTPIGITVEGANILTRSLIIFGQGAMRCHPYLLKEVEAAYDENESSAVEKFDQVFVQHLEYVYGNKVRTFFYALTRGYFAPSNGSDKTKYYFRHVSRLSAAFSFLSDMALLVLGGGLKRKEALSGRFADALSYMYMCTAILKHHQDNGDPSEDMPFVDWACQHALFETEQAIDGILRNFPIKPLGIALRLLVFPTGRWLRRPDDRLGQKVAKLLQSPSASRDRLTKGIYINHNPDDITGCLEHALNLTLEVEAIRKRLKDADRRQAGGQVFSDWLDELIGSGHIDDSEAEQLTAWHQSTYNVISVDKFEKNKVTH